MLNKYSKFRQITIKCFLIRCQLASTGFLERRHAKDVNPANPLKTFISYQQNIIKYMYPALPKKLKIMYPAFSFINAYDFAI